MLINRSFRTRAVSTSSNDSWPCGDTNGRSVTYTEVDRLLFQTCALKRLFAPRKPIYWIMCVLKEIGLGLVK